MCIKTQWVSRLSCSTKDHFYLQAGQGEGEQSEVGVRAAQQDFVSERNGMQVLVLLHCHFHLQLELLKKSGVFQNTMQRHTFGLHPLYEPLCAFLPACMQDLPDGRRREVNAESQPEFAGKKACL